MPFAGIANPEELVILRGAVDEFCGARGIVDLTRREDVAAVVLSLYSNGARTLEAIQAGLQTSVALQG